MNTSQLRTHCNLMDVLGGSDFALGTKNNNNSISVVCVDGYFAIALRLNILKSSFRLLALNRLVSLVQWKKK